jgi:Polysaccharide lyase family 4, domain III
MQLLLETAPFGSSCAPLPALIAVSQLAHKSSDTNTSDLCRKTKRRVFTGDSVLGIGASGRRVASTSTSEIPGTSPTGRPEAVLQPFRGVVGRGRATPYTIQFQMDDDPVGTGVLRLAICGTGARRIGVTVNGEPAGYIALNFGDGVIARHQVQGLWYERDLEFDASLLRRGRNTLELIVPEGSINAGVVYDYVRLELKGPSDGSS